MEKFKVWARIGVTMTLELPKNPTQNDFESAFKKALNEYNPGKLEFHFDGESYIAESEDADRLDLEEICITI